MGQIIWSIDDFAMGLCVEHSDDVAFWKVGKVSRRARPGMEQITGPVFRENMYEALGMANSAHSMDISLKQFSSGWTFFVIPLTSTLDDSYGFELLKSGKTTLRLQIVAPVPARGVEMIILGEFDQMILVHQNRRVITDSTLG